MQITKHFKLEKCRCPCCDRVKVMPGFFKHMKLLEAMRKRLGFPIIINSGYRCPKHNRNVGGASRSMHLLFATDVRPKGGKGRKERLELMHEDALAHGWGGVGIYNNFIHLDRRPKMTRWRG